MQILRMTVVLAIAGATPLAGQGRDSKVGAASGRYATAVQLGENSCGAVAVASMPTVITHRLGDTTITLAHGPLTHHAVLKPNGTFLTRPIRVGAAPGEVSTVQVAGRFTARGFLASVSVDVTGPRKCSYIVEWTGTREGS
ncbi:MAG: hypothetical protein H0W15_05100 [Gemmatimonadales bacterium]|nr:hypothetical protein [Gemmatimonadales bacterium]